VLPLFTTTFGGLSPAGAGAAVLVDGALFFLRRAGFLAVFVCELFTPDLGLAFAFGGAGEFCGAGAGVSPGIPEGEAAAGDTSV
jgi:hypothetical protein